MFGLLKKWTFGGFCRWCNAFLIENWLLRHSWKRNKCCRKFIRKKLKMKQIFLSEFIWNKVGNGKKILWKFIWNKVEFETLIAIFFCFNKKFYQKNQNITFEQPLKATIITMYAKSLSEKSETIKRRLQRTNCLIRKSFNEVHCTHFPLDSIYVLNNSDIKLNGISLSSERSNMQHNVHNFFSPFMHFSCVLWARFTLTRVLELRLRKFSFAYTLRLCTRVVQQNYNWM